MTRRFAATTLAACLMLIATPAVGDEPVEETETEEVDSADEERAMQYYQDARKAYGEGRYDRAAELLGLAYEYDPQLVYRYNQILALQGAGRYDEALELVGEYDEQMRADAEFDDIDEIGDELRAARDDDRVEELAELDAADEADEPEPESSDALAWTLAGGGAATFATGLLFGSGVLIGDTIDRLENSTTPEARDEIYGGQLYDRDEDLGTLRTHQVLSAVLLAGGAILGATGGVMLGMSDGDDGEPTATIDLQPAVDADRQGIMITGRF